MLRDAFVTVLACLFVNGLILTILFIWFEARFRARRKP